MTDRIDGHTRIVAILGDPVAQVKSPGLFNRLFEQAGVNAVLVPFEVGAAQLDAVLDGLRGVANLAGVVVTVPHKAAALRHAASLTSVARLVGAVNCLRREPDGAWHGAMFDGIGFAAGLAACAHPLRGRRALLVGAGGAGAAIAHALLDGGVAALDVCDIRSRAQRHLLDALRARGTPAIVRPGKACASGAHDLLINATPCGMSDDDPLPIDLSAARKGAVVADLIMQPATTRLLAEAAARGLAVHPGRHLLLHALDSMATFLGLPAHREADREIPIAAPGPHL